MIWVQATLHSEGINTVSLPPETGLDFFPDLLEPVKTGIGAAKLSGQKHPRYNYDI